jgi:hypothetical protein
MKTRVAGTLRAIALFAVALGLASCQSSEKIPPKGATINLAATPTTIPLITSTDCLATLGVDSCGTAIVVATVSSDLGSPLPDQDVRFTSTAGLLFTGSISSPTPASNIPIRTDTLGNATVNLVTSTTTTVNARSGLATGTLSLNTVQGNLSQIQLVLDTTSAGCDTPPITACDQVTCFIATAKDANGVGIGGVILIPKLVNNSTGNATFNGQFTPTQVTTSSDQATLGVATFTLKPDSTCQSQCGGGKCSNGTDVIAATQGGIQSSAVHIDVSIP